MINPTAVGNFKNVLTLVNIATTWNKIHENDAQYDKMFLENATHFQKMDFVCGILSDKDSHIFIISHMFDGKSLCQRNSSFNINSNGMSISSNNIWNQNRRKTQTNLTFRCENTL